MPKAVSYGVLIFNEDSHVLVAHVTGTRKWDIPKGGAEPGETAVQAAVRETFEETGIALQPAELIDLGRHPYLPKKDLHLFRCKLEAARCDVSAYVCTSFFQHHRTGHPTPEVDAFQWVALPELERLCSPNLAKLVYTLIVTQ
jgi:putative (di)nucleoside polyphosphate hydrolase